MPRYAILHDLHDPASRPVALVIESDKRIRVYAVDGFRARTSYDGDYQTIEPDGSIVTYRPGMDEYWDYVLLMLSRTFLVGEVAARPALANVDILELFYEKVAEAREPKPKPYLGKMVTTTVFRGFSYAQSFVSTVEVERDRGHDRHEDDDRKHEDRRHEERHRHGGVPVAA